MALQVQISGSPFSKSIGSVGSSWPVKSSAICCGIGEQRREKSVMGLIMKKKDNNNQKGLLCSTLETAGPVVGGVTAVDKDSFWPLVNAAGDKIVVLDMYTQWYLLFLSFELQLL